MRILLAALLLTAACAHGRADGTPDTEVTVTDEGGEPLLGTVSLWSRAEKDNCVLYGSSCTVALVTGNYFMTFRKERAGRPGSSVGGTVQSEKSAGCLRARVHLVPGQKITCKKRANQAFNCARGVQENMDCGPAAAALAGYQPRPDDEPPQQP